MTNKKEIRKKEIVSTIYHQFDKQINKLTISDAISIIMECFGRSLIEDGSLSIDNFGTFVTSVSPEREVQNIKTKEFEMVESFKTVSFFKHETFEYLLDEKRELLKEKAK